MFQIPQHVLEKLRCSICGSYLSSKPLMIRQENQQICGKCYKLLPTEEKNKCVRQIGLESVAEIITFPCRFNTQGCTYKFTWCDERDHEATCSYRSLIPCQRESSQYVNNEVISDRHLNHNENILHCETDQIKATLTYKIKENNNEFKNLSYSLNVKGNCNHQLLIKNEDSQESDEVNINMDGIVFFGNKPELVYSDIKVNPVQNIYESLRHYDVREKVCASCGESADHNQCLQGHTACNQCTANLCYHCLKALGKEVKSFCKNYSRGCVEKLGLDDMHRHEKNCNYNDFKCILEPCNVSTTLSNLKQHIKNGHNSEVFTSNEVNKKISNKDDCFIVFCHSGIFKCVYYYYKYFVEFFVTYVGPSDEAVNYFYEVIVNVKGYVISKKSKCSNWNNVMLEKGITFEKSELLGLHEKKLNTEVTLRIINKKISH